MNLPVHVLVIDDEPKNVQNRIYESLRSLTAGSSLDFRLPWKVQVPNGGALDIHPIFCDDATKAKKILFDPHENSQFNLILLDNDWKGNKTHGIDVLKDLASRGVPHPLLVLYTAHPPNDYIALALHYGAQAVVQKNDSVHFLNILLTAAEGLRHRLVNFDMISVATHHISPAIGTSLFHLREAESLLKESLPAVPAALDHIRSSIEAAERLDRLTNFFVRAARVQSGREGPRPLGEPVPIAAFAETLSSVINECWKDLLANPDFANRRASPPPALARDASCPAQCEVAYDPSHLRATLSETLRNCLRHGSGNECATLSLTADSELCLVLSNARQPPPDENSIPDITGGVGLSSLVAAACVCALPMPSFNFPSADSFVSTLYIARAARDENNP